ncbi:unnamed protein product [Vitrella brassicaformis CCMP3155]|uniref:Uncharacterized protein n=1 Tax=Vitrella brassicaformis (strain CCMP3155) TaxID=1169540 RepID=A0A0G4G040_VITBC|nr:unnamed protein product [Vitrella brassicaformis CCMP3155]|eukprot:CEM20882.1 unnamed protein product [Vitrella brassicaformis CCMP3155]
MPPPPLPEGFVVKKAPATKKAASKPKPKPKAKKRSKRAKVTKEEREAATKERQEAKMRHWNHQSFMKEHGWKRQLDPLYLPGHSWPSRELSARRARERAEAGDHDSSDEDDDGGQWAHKGGVSLARRRTLRCPRSKGRVSRLGGHGDGSGDGNSVRSTASVPSWAGRYGSGLLTEREEDDDTGMGCGHPADGGPRGWYQRGAAGMGRVKAGQRGL